MNSCAMRVREMCLSLCWASCSASCNLGGDGGAGAPCKHLCREQRPISIVSVTPGCYTAWPNVSSLTDSTAKRGQQRDFRGAAPNKTSCTCVDFLQRVHNPWSG